ncbi:MAG TPA: rhodanese-like domain-containing protein [Candidatus Acidoferrales bacterium]|nr:rhodanese-like domain-containing protein [Candidatus Acidoferrales bacterium]
MYFQSFYLSCLAHASYMVGSEGVAAVVDPQRDIDIYIEEARQQNLRIAYVLETHLHADFVSGHHELAARTGATICMSEAARAKFPHRALRDGDSIELGSSRLDFLATPGHTPESMCILLTDRSQSDRPWAVLTGDTLFIGDVGRPDLSPEFSAQQLAGMLYDSLRKKIMTLPDDTQVFPAHGAGSLCGRNISSERSSTIGKEKQFNYALQPMSREAFVKMLTAELPDRPGYFGRDAEINRAGAEEIRELAPLSAFTPEKVQQITSGSNARAVLLDTRPWTDFAAAHIPGSIHIGLSGQYASWAGTLIGLDTPIVLLAEDAERLDESRLRLARVGIERVEGYLDGGIEAWQRSGRPISQTAQVSAGELHRELNAGLQIPVIDVRRAAEWNSGHLVNARLAPLAQLAVLASPELNGLPAALKDLDRAQPVAVHCQGGYRSGIAASLLERAGFRSAVNVIGGYEAWRAQNLPVVAEEAGARH